MLFHGDSIFLSTLLLCEEKSKKEFLEVEVIDAGAKEKIAKAPDGKVIIINNAVPGDVVDVQTFKNVKGITKEKQYNFINFRSIEKRLNAPILELCLQMAAYEI